MSAMDEDYEQDDVEEETEEVEAEAEEAETEEADSSEVAEEASDVTEEQRARKSQKNKRKKLLRREKAKKAAEASNSWTGRMASVLNPKTMVSFALGIAKTMVAPLVPAQPEVLSAEPKRKINKLQRQIKTMKKQLKEMKEVIQSNQGPIGLNPAVPAAPPVAMGFIPAAPPVFDIPAAPPVMGFIPPPPPVPAGPTVAETTLQKVARQGICLLDITSVKLKSASDRPDNSPGKKRSAGGPLISQDQLDRIKLRKTSALGEAKQERPPSTPGMIDFKEMARIQLKKVDGVNRSPGGTPFKAKEPAVPKNLAPSQIKDTLRKKLALEEVVMSHDENSQADAASFDRQANAQAATVPSKVEAAFEAPKKAQEPQETADQIPSVLITPVAPSKHVRFAAEPEPLAKDMDGFDVPPTRARAASMSAAAGRADRLPLPSSSLFAVPISPVGQTKFVSRDTAKAALAEAAQHTSAVPANDRRLSRMGLPGGPTRGPMRSRVSRQIAADMRF